MTRILAALGLCMLSAAGARALPAGEDASAVPPRLQLSWDKNMLRVHGDHLPGKTVDVWYLEAYCRAGSTDRDWGETVIKHETQLVSLNEARNRLELQCRLADGLIVDHVITAHADEVDFRLKAHNPTRKRSEAHWAQPCVRVGPFTGTETVRASEEYLPKSFIVLDGKFTRLPTTPWAKEARYVPGQVWCPRHVDRNDVNPRPLSKLVPSHGLIGCYSHDESMILATAWEPYQELFQGVIVCLHSDFRLGGIEPEKSLEIRGKLYLVKNDADALWKRYLRDFPEHKTGKE